MNNFENFTGLYDLPRSLRFELKAIGETKILIDEESEIFPKDKRIDEIYENIVKPCLNNLHSELIEENLENISLSSISDDIFEIYKNEKKNKKFEEIKQELRKEIVSFLTTSKKNTFIKGYKDLLSKNATEIIVKKYGEKIYEKDNSGKNFGFLDLVGKTYKELIETYFQGFSTYLKNFHINRENLYKSEGKFGSIATRIVDENFIRFLQNISVFEEKINSYNILSQSEKELFLGKNFEKYLNQKGIDFYNTILGNIHSKINEYNQKNNLKGNKKLPKLSLLYKQILGKSSKEDISNFVDNIIQTDNELAKYLKDFIKNSTEKINFIEKNIFGYLEDYNLERVFIKKGKLKDFSNLFLENYSTLEKLLPEIDDEGKIKKDEEIVSLEEIKKAFNNEENNLEEIFKKEYFTQNKKGFTLFLDAIKLYFENLKNNLKNSHILLEKYVFLDNFSENLRKTEKNIELGDEKKGNTKNIIKMYLDIFLSIDRLVHSFDLIKGQGKDKKIIETEFDTDFYGKVSDYSRNFNPYKFYNSVRNYLTKKTYSQEKIKINFDYPDFLGGNSLGKYAFIYRDNEEKFYLGVLDHSISQTRYSPKITQENTGFFQMEYKQLKFNTLAGRGYIRDFGVKYSEDKNAIQNLKILIKKQYLEKYPQLQEIVDFKTTSKKEFDAKVMEVMPKTYSAVFVNIDKNYIDKEIDEKRLYLFQIYNKDFSKYKKIGSKDNLHTMYFKALFSRENFQNGTCFKLNSSGAEIFFREKSINEKKVKKLNTENENIIEKKRYTENKILFHLPISLNFINKKDFKVNDRVQNYIKENKIKIIGIDRGEKHLLYISLIDENGEILQIKTLNEIIVKKSDGEEISIDYAKKLVEKEGNRDIERKNWDEIETIKELKDGYISQVVDEIVKLAIQENAIIVMEDLNGGFKRGRQKIERQVYQKFELALAKKLNFVVDKNKEKTTIGGLYKAYQLTPKIENFQDIFNQTGIIFYTQASYTSTTCPKCGFRKNIYKTYENENNFKKWFLERNFDINYKNGEFIISYKIEEKEDKRHNKLEKLNFTLSTKNQIRYRFVKSKKGKGGEIKKFNIFEGFEKFCKKYNLGFENITEKIKNWNGEVSLYKDFLFNFNLLLQVRNSEETGDNGGYISCPCCLFNSDNKFQNFDFNGDANGAYNIARKGKMIIDKIRNNEKSLGVSIVEWDNFVSGS